MNLFYPSYLLLQSLVGQHHEMRPSHRFSFYQLLFLYIAFCVHSVVCGFAHPVIPLLLFSVLLDSAGFSSYTILRMLYTPQHKDMGS